MQKNAGRRRNEPEMTWEFDHNAFSVSPLIYLIIRTATFFGRLWIGVRYFLVFSHRIKQPDIYSFSFFIFDPWELIHNKGCRDRINLNCVSHDLSQHSETFFFCVLMIRNEMDFVAEQNKRVSLSQRNLYGKWAYFFQLQYAFFISRIRPQNLKIVTAMISWHLQIWVILRHVCEKHS